LNQTNVIIFPGEKLKVKRQAVFHFRRHGKDQETSDTQTPTLRPAHFSFLRKKKVKLEGIYTFANQLSVLLESGVPLLSALSILEEQSGNAFFKTVIFEVKENIRKGGTLHQSFAHYPNIFPGLMVSMVKAAEIGGNLPDILRQTAGYLEEQDKLNKKLKAAIVYPKFVFYFFIVLLAGIIFFLIPNFKETFADFGMQLPAPTQMLVNGSQFLMDHFIVESLLILAGFITLKKLKQTEQGLYIIDKIKLTFPIVGNIVHKSTLSKFCRTLKILVRSGVSLVDSLAIAAETAQNKLFSLAISAVKINVIEGTALSNALERQAIFPQMVVKMIATGEEAGSLEKMLKNISDLYDTDVNSKIIALTSIIEPIMMVVLGILTVLVIIALYLPIFNMSNIIY